MRFLLVFHVLTILFIACNSDESTKKEQVYPNKTSTKVKAVAKVTPPKDILISNKNVEDKLLAYGKENPETIVLIHTTFGKIKVRLFEETPLHRANFIMWVKKGYFTNSVFSRVVKGFMAQAGGSYEEYQLNIKKSIGNYTIPNEFNKKLFHKRGAIAAARKYLANPEKRSEPDEFYFVEGSVYSHAALDKYERDNNYKYSKAQRAYYTKTPGAAHLDGEHTVFGEIIEGFEVVPKLTAVDTDSQDWPVTDIYVEKIEIIK